MAAKGWGEVVAPPLPPGGQGPPLRRLQPRGARAAVPRAILKGPGHGSTGRGTSGPSAHVAPPPGEQARAAIGPRPLSLARAGGAVVAREGGARGPVM